MEIKDFELIKRIVAAPGAAALAVGAGNEIHVAMMHYSFADDLSAFYFSTDQNSRKVALIRASGKRGPASLAIGTRDEDSQFVQVDGQCMVLQGGVPEDIKDRHLDRNPSAAEFKDDPDTVYLKFTPERGVLTDYSRGEFQIPFSSLMEAKG
ncbi:MAG: pyridoxamine 5'-phosphate oxidase family protein [Rhizobiaceae bacterium]